MFYQGTLQEGISTAVGQQKLVLCFVTNENEESEKWENEYLREGPLLTLIETQAVALRLLAGSEEAGYLSQIFPLPKTPTVVIMKHGELKEYIAAGTSREDFLRRMFAAFNAAPPAAVTSSSSPTSPASSPATSPTRLSAPVPAAAAPVTAAPVTPASPFPSTFPPPSVTQMLAARAAQIKAEKEEAERKAREEAEAEAARAHSQSEELKKKRQAEQEERRRILQRIKDDREERRRLASEQKQQRLDSQKVGAAAAAASPPMSKLPSTTKMSDMASIQVRLFDGSTIRSRFKTASPLKEVRRWVDENRGESKAPYTFKQVLTPLPNKNIDATEENKALGELGLVPSSTLVLIPVQKYSSAYSSSAGRQDSVFSRFLRLVLGFFTWLLSLVGLAGEQREAAGRREPERAPDATARASSEERRRRVQGLQNLVDRQRDHQLYNGNSLNFEPRPDDDEK
ncbi:hypothetical protein TARUN_4684 [Trichoderma arundinaceum]|uniref:UBX domain-containing protein n=1 Tax=Trichoderma arundinaceum TaxID=490622 RepID=A0A395NNI9_TRIAR|nr:hypothetical protein TARUN_4684 [Trichoderma arundinaceum]